jgi:alkylhydroperoxidase/carboxymuconolactone decarboxylase family protein YurZ
MANEEENIHRLRAKYGARGIDNAARMHPKDFEKEMSWRDDMDPQYTRLCLDFTYGGLMTRGVLAERVRLLVLIAQCAAMAEMDYLESSIRAALNEGVSPREVLEILLQTTVYVGMPKINRAARLFHGIIGELGRMDELRKTRPPIEGRNAERSLEAERATWSVTDERFPTREAMLKKYGWYGISAGLRLQPTHHPEAILRMNRTDQNFLKYWLDFIYGGMYVRGVLDDKTRILCVVGVCTALDELVQGVNHVRAALMLGATPREVQEVAVQSTQYWGMPRSLRLMQLLDSVLKEQGREAELTETQLPMPA